MADQDRGLHLHGHHHNEHRGHQERGHHERGWLYACVFTLCCCFCCHEACEGCMKILCCCQPDEDKKK